MDDCNVDDLRDNHDDKLACPRKNKRQMVGEDSPGLVEVVALVVVVIVVVVGARRVPGSEVS